MEGRAWQISYLAVNSTSKALPESEVGDFEFWAYQVVDGVEHVKVHNAKGRTGLCEEHVVNRLQKKVRVCQAGQTGSHLRIASYKNRA